jgi:plastocyanin
VPSRPRAVPAWLLVLVLTITLSGCRGGPGEGGTKAPAAPPVTGVTEVVGKDLRFQPPAIQVEAGTEVTWRFADGSVPHNVKGDGFASKDQTKGTFAHRFGQPGEYRYTCTLHAGMDGRVVVTG